MLPLHHFGKARQAELLKLVERAPAALERETDDHERADVKKTVSFDAAQEDHKAVFANERKDSSGPRPLKQSVWSKLLRMLGKYGQAA